MSVIINETNFPDASFRSYVSTYYDTDGDGVLSDAEIAAVTEIDLPAQFPTNYDELWNLSGLEYFTNLQSIRISSDALGSFSFTTFTELISLETVHSLYYVKGSLVNRSIEITNDNCFELDLSRNTKLTNVTIKGKNRYGRHGANYGGISRVYLPTSILNFTLNEVTTSTNSGISINFRYCTNIQSIVIVNAHLPKLYNLSNKAQLKSFILWTSEESNYDNLYSSKYVWSATSYTLSSLELSNNIRLETVKIAGYNLSHNLSISGCTALSHLTIATCNLLGTLDLSSFLALKCINVANNKLTGLELGITKPSLQALYAGHDYSENIISQIVIPSDSPLRRVRRYYRSLAYHTANSIYEYSRPIALPSISYYHVANTQSASWSTDEVIWSKDYNIDIYVSDPIYDVDNADRNDITILSYRQGRTTIIDFDPPSITTHPASKMAAAGVSTSLSVVANYPYSNILDGEQYSYQWETSSDNGTNWAAISGAASETYTFTPVKADSGNRYRCVVSNAAGSVTSNSATLTVLDPPYITTQPTLPADVPANQSQTISVTATGDNVEYEWQESTNGSSYTRIPGATSSSYIIEHPEDYNGHYFRCYLYNDVGEATSNAVYLHVVYIPTITNDLLEAYTVSTRTDITFTIEATGGSLTYVWYRKAPSDSTWTQIENSNSASYSFNAKRSDSGTKYYCEVRNAAGNRNSAEVTLTVFNPPEIITQPRIDSSIAENATVDISVTASGDDLSYQWQASTDGRTFADITNATASTYRITASSYNSGYYYRCHVYNGVGETDSNAVQLNVVYVPDITAELADISVKTNQIVTLSITATGGNLSYQWKRQEFNASIANNIPNATSDAYTFTAVKPTTGTKWIYSCDVENTAGKKTTSCTVTVLDAVAITQQPSLPAAIPLDSEQTLSVTATGDDIHYQWEVSSDGTNYSAISGENSATYAITASRENSKKYYRCKVYNDASSVFSASIYLNAVSAPEIVTQLPETVVISTGRLVVLTIEATGESLTYTWYKQASNSSAWNKVSGATLPEYSFTAVKAESGSKYRCEVRNVDGFEMSSVATLTVLDPVAITSQPELPDEITIDSINSISVTATGDDIHYQWEVSSDGTNYSAISGANSATYSVSATQTNAGKSYRCRVYNDTSESISDTVILNVIFTPQIVSESFPTNTIAHGTRITFSITAVGGGLSYHWQVSNDNEVSWENIVDAPNAPTYSFIASASQSGYRYRCSVENRVGTAFSSSATLNVISPPAILSAPVSITVGNNASATFSISASGSNLSFQWQESSNYGSSWTDIENATSRTYSFTASIRQDAHQYRCKVWNDIDTLVSSAAVLTVLTVPSITVQPRSLTVSYANTAVFTVSATGGNLSYQWEQRSSSSATWQTINQNGTFPTYSFVAIDAEDGYQYRCLVKNSIGQVYSEVATLTVTPFEEPDAGDDSSVHEGEYLPSQMAEMIRSLIVDNTNLDTLTFGHTPNDTIYERSTNPGVTDPKWYEDIAEAINEVKAFIESLELDE